MTAVGLSDIEVPRAVILRRIKNASGNKPVQKEAKLALTKSVTVFISYLTAIALAQPNLEAKPAKSLTLNQVLDALDAIGFSSFRAEVLLRIQQHKEYMREKAEQKAANVTMQSDSDSEGVDDDNEDNDHSTEH